MHGIRVDYLSPTLYFTDILLVAILVIDYRHLKIHKHKFAIVSFIIIILINCIISLSPFVTLYKWIRVCLLLGLYIYLVNNLARIKMYLIKGLIGALIWTSGLAINQFIFQGSSDGWWYWLGERSFSISTPGIAKVSIGNFGQMVRPYATLPHPNALAGWLGLTTILVSYFHRVPKTIVAFVTAALVLTMSRLSIAALAVSSPKWYLAILVLGLVAVLPGNPDSWQERINLINHSFKQITSYPIFGTGLGSSLITSPVNFQPVHNIYLLLLVELGLPIGLIILYMCRKIFYLKNIYMVSGLIFLLITGLGDHYWFTIWQCSLLLTIFIAVSTVELASEQSSSVLRWRGTR